MTWWPDVLPANQARCGGGAGGQKLLSVLLLDGPLPEGRREAEDTRLGPSGAHNRVPGINLRRAIVVSVWRVIGISVSISISATLAISLVHYQTENTCTSIG